jgi:hypothetical protein
MTATAAGSAASRVATIVGVVTRKWVHGRGSLGPASR